MSRTGLRTYRSARFLGSTINGEVFAALMSPARTRGMRDTWPVLQKAISEGDF